MNNKTRASRKPEPQSDLHPQTQMESNPRPKWEVRQEHCRRPSVFITGTDTQVCQCWTIEEANLAARAVNSFDDLLEALKPFARAAKELRQIGDIAANEQYLWKPHHTSRDTAGVSAAHVLAALKAFEKAEGRAMGPEIKLDKRLDSRIGELS